MLKSWQLENPQKTNTETHTLFSLFCHFGKKLAKLAKFSNPRKKKAGEEFKNIDYVRNERVAVSWIEIQGVQYVHVSKVHR